MSSNETITSRRNPLCLHIKKLGTSRSYRDECGAFLCDGKKLLEEALKYGAEIETVITASDLPFALPAKTRLYRAEQTLIDSISPLKTAQDTLFVCKIPETGEVSDFSENITGTHILLDNVQDPGNVGTIIRTANAFGIKSVILTGNCADPYNPKTIRASMGASFRQKVYRLEQDELIMLRENGARFIGAVPGENSEDISDVSLKNSIIAIGNEGTGLSDEVLSLCETRVRIPISPDCDSLNAAAAAAIIMWLARG